MCNASRLFHFFKLQDASANPPLDNVKVVQRIGRRAMRTVELPRRQLGSIRPLRVGANLFVFTQMANQIIVRIQNGDPALKLGNNQLISIACESIGAGQEFPAKGPQVVPLPVIDLDSMVPPVGDV
jgi:hypothetical protein